MKSVKMSPSKAAARAAAQQRLSTRHARCPSDRDWLRIGQMKITVKCPTVQELLELQEKCAAAGLNCYLIRDAGHTEIEPGSRTVLAVGPARERWTRSRDTSSRISPVGKKFYRSARALSASCRRGASSRASAWWASSRFASATRAATSLPSASAFFGSRANSS